MWRFLVYLWGQYALLMYGLHPWIRDCHQSRSLSFHAAWCVAQQTLFVAVIQSILQKRMKELSLRVSISRSCKLCRDIKFMRKGIWQSITSFPRLNSIIRMTDDLDEIDSKKRSHIIVLPHVRSRWNEISCIRLILHADGNSYLWNLIKLNQYYIGPPKKPTLHRPALNTQFYMIDLYCHS